MRYSLHFLSCWAHVRFIQPYHSLCVCFFGIALFSNYKLFTLRSFTVFVDLLNNDLLFAILCQQIDDFAILWTIRVNSKLINIKRWISVKLPKKQVQQRIRQEKIHTRFQIWCFFFFRKEKNDVEQKAESSFHQPICMPQCHLSLNTVLGYFSHFVLMITWYSFILCLCGLQILFKFFWFVMIIFSARISSDSISKKLNQQAFSKRIWVFQTKKELSSFWTPRFHISIAVLQSRQSNTSMKKFVHLIVFLMVCVLFRKYNRFSCFFFLFFLHSTRFQPKKKKVRVQRSSKKLNLPFQRVWIFLFSKIVSPLAHTKKTKFGSESLCFCQILLFFSLSFEHFHFPHFFSFCLNKQKTQINHRQFQQPSPFYHVFLFLKCWHERQNISPPNCFVSCSWHCLNWFVLSMFCVCLMFVFWFSNDPFFLRTNNHEPYFGPHKSTTTKKQEQQINDENNLICYSFIHFLIWS